MGSSSMNTPGPGAYDLVPTERFMRGAPDAASLRSKSIKMAEKVVNDAPGPGSYKTIEIDRVRAYAAGPKYTFRARTLAAEDFADASPGPAVYSPSKAAVSQHYSFPKGSRGVGAKSDDPATKPGPAHYTVSNTTQFQRSPAHRVGTSVRADPTPSDLTPGPGAHHREKKISETAGFSISSKWKEMHSRDAADITPGPGAYSSERVSDKVWFGAFAKAKEKKRAYDEVVPGPGQYDVPRQATKVGTRFGKSTRDMNGGVAKSNPIGPGQYENPAP